jgi:hypothetical protein
MSEITYYVALPFVSADDSFAPGEAVECLNPNAAIMKAEALARNQASSEPSRSAGVVISQQETLATRS